MSPPVLARRTSPDLSGAVGADVLAVPVATGVDGPEPRSGTAEVVAAYGIDLAAVCDAARFTGRAGTTLVVQAASAPAGGLPAQVLLVGTGSGTPLHLRRAGAALARACRGRERVATTAAALAGAAGVRAFCQGLLLASWSPPRTGLDDPTRPAVRRVDLLGVPDALGGPESPDGRAAIDGPDGRSAPVTADDLLVEVARTAGAVLDARDVAATPPAVAGPAWVAARAVAAARDLPALDVEVLDAAALADRGAGALLAVGAAAPEAPRVALVRYLPDSARHPGAGHPAAAGPAGEHVVLVGGGLTYDTGGLALRPRAAMAATTGHVAGAAAALAVLVALAREGTHPGPVTAVLPLVENALGGSAHRPGDVVRAASGATVEVTDAGAAGLLVLADALALAEVDLAPDVLLDLAPASPAAEVALGRRHAALFTDDAGLAASLEAAAEASGERVWRMPLVEDLLPSLDSAVADLRQPPGGAVPAGAVTAALFLREFAGGRRWAHLDITGPLRATRDEHELVRGATGVGVRLLLEWFATRARPGAPQGADDPPT